MAARDWKHFINYHPLFKLLQQNKKFEGSFDDCKNILTYNDKEIFVWNRKNSILTANLAQLKDPLENSSKKPIFQVKYTPMLFNNFI